MFNKKHDFIDITIGLIGFCMFLLVAIGFFFGTIAICIDSKIRTGKWWS